MYCKQCGAVFDGNTNAKYCSVKCRKDAYNKFQRDRKAAIRKQKHEQELSERLKKIKLAKQKEQRADKKREEKRTAVLENRVATGEPFALMQKYTHYDEIYWTGYKKYQMEYATSTGKPCTATVNDIPVISENFEKLVVQSIIDSRCIVTHAH